MVKVIISSHITSRNKSNQPYTVYVVDVYHNGKSHTIQRRYRDFHKLHTELRKLSTQANRNNSIKPSNVEFPPKKLRNLSHKLIEQRKDALEKYLQSVLHLNTDDHLMPRVLVDFLGITASDSELGLSDGFASSTGLLDRESLSDDSIQCDGFSHQPLIGFTSDLNRYPFDFQTTVSTDATNGMNNTNGHHPPTGSNRSRESSCSSLPDIVLKGVMDAFYSDSDIMSNDSLYHI